MGRKLVLRLPISVCICTYSLLTGERFSPGVGQVNATDEIKREIIHQLSIKPMAHSELVKSLPEDENKETGMESVIEAVAHFK
ncbi:UBR2 [Cervus elaphus hippelaphus]|uniref:E3 ubiquitin-protein ligase n=1 Tax=Cervus elaphus hippelaphus TaxID=46360 RepID=A0A212D5I3_CEREH|nr:UBR2 [Cervus elaphus hippelaphus]